MVPHIRGQRRCRSPIALAMAVLLVLLVPSAASAAAPGWLDPQAGWHGRAIQRPLPASSPVGQATASGSSEPTVFAGDGFASANGSVAVRRVQRILLELGYGTGRVDGRFGPRTRSAVAWFQVKHGLTVDGIAGPRTLRWLAERSRASRPPSAGAQARRPVAPPAAEENPQAPRAANPDAAEAADPGDRWLTAAIAVAAILAATLIGLLLRRRRRTAEGTVVSLTQPLWVAGTSSDPAVGRFAGTTAALHVSPPAPGSDVPPAIRYCVIDEATGLAVWVSPQDIQESRGLDDRQRRRIADAPAGRPASAARAGRRFSRPGVRPRRGGAVRSQPPGASQLECRVTWFRSLGMPPEAIADLLTDENVPPPEGHSGWSAQTVAAIGGGDAEQAPAAVGRPARAGELTDDEREGRSD
jgi:peptidoglycan hydrolase-like protein with peptidoglycan-binding domain